MLDLELFQIQHCKYFIRWDALDMDLKDPHKAFWWVLLNIKIACFCTRKLHMTSSTFYFWRPFSVFLFHPKETLFTGNYLQQLLAKLLDMCSSSFSKKKKKKWSISNENKLKGKCMSCNHVKRGHLQNSIPPAACRRQRVTHYFLMKWRPLNPALTSTNWWVFAGYCPHIACVLISWNTLGSGGRHWHLSVQMSARKTLFFPIICFCFLLSYLWTVLCSIYPPFF